MDAEGKPDPSTTEAFAEEARYFTETRLLQRDVEVVLESVNNQNFVGSIIHPVSLNYIIIVLLLFLYMIGFDYCSIIYIEWKYCRVAAEGWIRKMY